MTLDTNRIIEGDAFDVLGELPADSVHAVVTDPPYGLGFMPSRNEWDSFDSPGDYQRWCERWADAAKRVLKPGGHLLAFSGDRTYHRLACGIEDAGFEYRSVIMWLFGNGFPKSLDVSKAIEKQRDDEAEQRVVCRWLRGRIDNNELSVQGIADEFGYHSRMVDHWAARGSDSQPATPTLEQWKRLKGLLGFGDEMDPLVNWLNERKGEPADVWHEREVVQTLEDHGERNIDILQGAGGEYDITAPATEAGAQWEGFKTGLKPALEPIALARKPLSEGTVAENVVEHGTGALNIDATRIAGEKPKLKTVGERPDGDAASCYDFGSRPAAETSAEGRYPANLVLDRQAAAMLDGQSGEAGDLVGFKNKNDPDDADLYGDARPAGSTGYSDSGGASRFFYTSKASRAERTLDGTIENAHPTVKPVDLMTWLVELATAEGQTVLDPFAGTGTTCRAAKDTGREFVGVEQSAQWADVARARCGLTVEDPGVLREDGEAGLEAFVDGGGQ